MLEPTTPEDRAAAARRLLESLRARGFDLGVDYSYPCAPVALGGASMVRSSGAARHLRPRWLHLINHGPDHIAQLTPEDRGWLEALQPELISLVVELAIRTATPDCKFCSAQPGMQRAACSCGWEGQVRGLKPDGRGTLRCPECSAPVPTAVQP